RASRESGSRDRSSGGRRRGSQERPIAITGKQASQQTSLPASKQAAITQESVRTLSPSTRRKLRDLLEREHRTHNTYRYHDDELAAVRDIVYELEVRWARKVTRNDVMRSAVLSAIEDH